MKCIIVLLLVFFFSFPVSGEYYRYTDKQGVVHFTDNLGDVPKAQRTESNSYEEIQDAAGSKDAQKEEQALPETPAKKIEPNQTGDGNESETLSQLQTLNREKEILDNLYEQLVTRKQALNKEKESLSTSTEVSAYQKKIKTLNQEISDFEKRRKNFEEKAKKFNAQVAP
jgi:hypothetical protein